MGKRGPKPTPTAVLDQRGSWRAKERSEPDAQPLNAPPAAPAHLDDSSRHRWESLCQTLWASGRLTADDVQSFERYCRTFTAWHRAMQQLETAKVIDREMALTLEKIDAMLRRLEANFGLSPADRAALAIPSRPDDEDGKSRFFKRPAIVA